MAAGLPIQQGQSSVFLCICKALQARGLLAKETHDHIIRIAPPLILTQDQGDWIAEQFAAVLR